MAGVSQVPEKAKLEAKWKGNPEAEKKTMERAEEKAKLLNPSQQLSLGAGSTPNQLRPPAGTTQLNISAGSNTSQRRSTASVAPRQAAGLPPSQLRPTVNPSKLAASLAPNQPGMGQPYSTTGATLRVSRPNSLLPSIASAGGRRSSKVWEMPISRSGPKTYFEKILEGRRSNVQAQWQRSLMCIEVYHHILQNTQTFGAFIK